MSDQNLLQLYKSLPANLKQEVLDFIEFISQKAKKKLPDPQEVTTQKREGFGSLKGKVWMAPDFDEPLDDFKEYM